MIQRAFVLVPLVEIAPDWVEPVSEQSIFQLLQKLDCSGLKLLSEYFASRYYQVIAALRNLQKSVKSI